MNSVKTADADCFGARTSKTMMMGSNATIWQVTKMPSARGKCFAPKTLNMPMAMTEAKMRSVACHLVGT